MSEYISLYQSNINKLYLTECRLDGQFNNSINAIDQIEISFSKTPSVVILFEIFCWVSYFVILFAGLFVVYLETRGIHPTKRFYGLDYAHVTSKSCLVISCYIWTYFLVTLNWVCNWRDMDQNNFSPVAKFLAYSMKLSDIDIDRKESAVLL